MFTLLLAFPLEGVAANGMRGAQAGGANCVLLHAVV
jgi:hypothetical protein